jgi:hypothetical protein
LTWRGSHVCQLLADRRGSFPILSSQIIRKTPYELKTTPVSSITTKDATESQKGPSQSIKILKQEIARNTPESQVWAGSTATTLIPRFFLGKEYRFEDHDSTLFVALKRKTPQYQFQLANALWKKGGPQLVSRDVRVLFGDITHSGDRGRTSPDPAVSLFTARRANDAHNVAVV